MTLALLDLLGGAGGNYVAPVTAGPGVPLWLVLLDGAGSPVAAPAETFRPHVWSRRYMTRRNGR